MACQPTDDLSDFDENDARTWGLNTSPNASPPHNWFLRYVRAVCRVGDGPVYRNLSPDSNSQEYATPFNRSSKGTRPHNCKGVLSACRACPSELSESPPVNINSGHCADLPDWDERGDCMCSITWRMPGAYPREYCHRILARRKKVRRWSRSVGPFVLFRPPSPSESEKEAEKRDHHEYDVFGSRSDHPYHNWKRGVKWKIAEDLPKTSPPPAEFLEQTESVAKVQVTEAFSPWFFKVPYYSIPRRWFVYGGDDEDLRGLNLTFKNILPPPIPVRMVKPVKRPKAVPKITSAPKDLEPGVLSDPWALDRAEESPPKLFRKPAKRLVLRPRDLPALNIKERKKPIVPKKPPTNDGDYLPSLDESETESDNAPAKPASRDRTKKHKKRRRRRNSDPAYRQHGVRENNRIEKEDLKRMNEELNGKSGETVEIQGRKGAKGEGAKSILPAMPLDTPTPKKGGDWKPAWAPTPHPKKPSRMRDIDADFVPEADSEEERQEQEDVKNMKEEEPEAEAMIQDPVESSRETMNEAIAKYGGRHRRRIPIENRAYRPGKDLGIRGVGSEETGRR